MVHLISRLSAQPEPARLVSTDGRTDGMQTREQTQTDMPHRFLTKGENQSNGEQIAFLTNAATAPGNPGTKTEP